MTNNKNNMNQHACHAKQEEEIDIQLKLHEVVVLMDEMVDALYANDLEFEDALNRYDIYHKMSTSLYQAVASTENI